MNLAHRNEYLEAMGIDVWVRRDQPSSTIISEADSLVDRKLAVGPGSGSTLLICSNSSETATPIATDIARLLDSEPVWAWPESDESKGQASLGQAINERLFTHVLLFDSEYHSTSLQTDSNAQSKVVGSACLMTTFSLVDLGHNGQAKKALWELLCANYW